MKKLLIILTAILIISLICLSAISTNAAVITKYSSGDVTESEVNGEDGEDEDNTDTDEIIDALSSKYSSAELGYTTSVKNQIGSLCWAYSSISTFESTLLKNNMFLGDLNPLSIDYWGVTNEDGEGWLRSDKDAGYTSISVGNFMSWNGPLITDETAPRYGTTALRFLGKNDIIEIKRAVIKNGAVVANLNYNSLGRSTDKNSFFITDSIGKISGHSMSIVGWDDNYSKENFTGNYQPENDGAWLCKNSWGEQDSPIGGYLWVSYEDYYFMNENYFDYGFSIESFQEIKETDHLYQNEIYGATYEFKYINESNQTFFNVFDFDDNGNVLDKVIFETPCVGALYNTYYVPLDDEEKPVQNRKKWTKLSSGTVEYNGYICSDFDDVIVSKTKAAIAVELDTSKIGQSCKLGVSEWLRESGSATMIFIDTCESGKSFVEYSEGLYDIKDYYKDKLNDEIGGTLVIKAITNNTVDTNIKGDVNLDGVLNINDATQIQLYLVNLMPEMYGDQLKNADFNGDGKINIRDVTSIQIELARKTT